MTLAPGIAFLAPCLPSLLLPLVVVYVAQRLLWTAFDIALPPWLLAITYLACWPVIISGWAQWSFFRAARKTADAGAVLPPTVKSRLPFAFDIIARVAKDRKLHWNGAGFLVVSSLQFAHTICEGFRLMEWTEQYGFTFNVRVLMQNRVSVLHVAQMFWYERAFSRCSRSSQNTSRQVLRWSRDHNLAHALVSPEPQRILATDFSNFQKGT